MFGGLQSYMFIIRGVKVGQLVQKLKCAVQAWGGETNKQTLHICMCVHARTHTHTQHDDCINVFYN